MNLYITNRKRKHPEDDSLVSMLSRLTTQDEKYDNSNPSSLSAQATYVANLIWIMKKTTWCKYDRKCYLISADWLEKWRKYVQFDEEGDCVNNENLEVDLKENPGPIQNQFLIEEDKDFIHNPLCSESPYNFIIKKELKENKEYYVVTKDIWNYLYSIYGGKEIGRDCIYFGANGRIHQDITMLKVIVIPI